MDATRHSYVTNVCVEFMTDTRACMQKLIQYSIRVYLWFHAQTVSSLMGKELNKRLKSTMSGLSLVRSVSSPLLPHDPG